ncbi:MAG: cytochrome P450 [Nostocoides sp.]
MTAAPERVPAGIPYDLFGPGVLADPYPWYRGLRTHSPVHYVPERDIWVLSRFDDVKAALLNHRALSSADGIAYGRESTGDIVTTDPPAHTRLRRLVNTMFTPRAVALMESRIRDIIAGLLDEVCQRGHGDWIADVAVPLPITVIAEILGIDADDRADFKHWSTSIFALLSGDHSAEDWARLDADRSACVVYLRTVIAERHHGALDAGDLISVLLRAQEGDQLTDTELLNFCTLLLVAGNETTTNAIGNGLLAMQQNGDQMALLDREPGLINSAVEETLRYDAPIQGLFRTARSDVQLPGGTVPSGARVLLLYGSANRDSEVFADGDTLQITRNPTKHLAFGAGIHACVGAALARLELRLLAEESARRRLLPNGPNRRSDHPSTPLTRGLLSMPVAVR